MEYIIFLVMRKSIYSKEQKHLVCQLIKARQEAGLSQIQVAEVLERTQSYISKIESGQRRIDVVQLKQFSEIYGKPLDFFL